MVSRTPGRRISVTSPRSCWNSCDLVAWTAVSVHILATVCREVGNALGAAVAAEHAAVLVL